MQLPRRKHLFLVLIEVRRGQLPHMNVDAVLPIALQRIAPKFPQLELNEAATAQLHRAWHSMQAWEDFPPALAEMMCAGLEDYTGVA